MTPLNQIGAPPLISTKTTAGSGALPRIAAADNSLFTPKEAAPPLTPVVKAAAKHPVEGIMEATKTTVEASKTSVGSTTPPPLQKVPRSSSKASTDPSQYRPKWNGAETPALQNSGIQAKEEASMYVITCRSNICEVPKIEGNTFFGVYTYDEAMRLKGKDLRDKLIRLITDNISDLVPTLVNAAINMGTMKVDVLYSPASVGNTIATINLRNVTDDDKVTRSYIISRVNPNRLEGLRF
jgi:hypothetical protein